jgi:hypothetical protein
MADLDNTAMQNTFFGEPWPSEICQRLEPGPTPIGNPCTFCEEPIVDGDQGSWVGAIRMIESEPVPGWSPTHRECLLRQVLGGLPHMERRCQCFGGVGYTETDRAMSQREEALAVWAAFMRRQSYRFN